MTDTGLTADELHCLRHLGDAGTVPADDLPHSTLERLELRGLVEHLPARIPPGYGHHEGYRLTEAGRRALGAAGG